MINNMYSKSQNAPLVITIYNGIDKVKSFGQKVINFFKVEPYIILCMGIKLLIQFKVDYCWYVTKTTFMVAKPWNQ